MQPFLNDLIGRRLSGPITEPATIRPWGTPVMENPTASSVSPVANKDAPIRSRVEPGFMGEDSHMASFKHGTDYVPKTGVYKLHEGEKVVPKKETMENKHLLTGLHELAGKEGEKPEKKIKHIVHRRAHDGTHIFEHHHTHPEHHPMEEHTKHNSDAAIEHFMEHATDKNPGEEEAEAGNPESFQGAPQEAAAGPPAAGAGPAVPPVAA